MPKPPAGDLFVLPDEYQPGPRSRRSPLDSRSSEELNVETLVVVDTQMLRNHGQENVTTYVLTILNMVSSPARASTPGERVRVRVCVCSHAAYALLSAMDLRLPPRSSPSVITPSALLCSHQKSHF